jgi:hypothetical protein
VELLVVIAIIGVLVSVLLPALSSVRESADGTKCISNLRQIAIAFTNYAADHDGNLPPAYRGGPEYEAVAMPLLLHRKYLPLGRIETVKAFWSNEEFEINRTPIYECPTARDSDIGLTNGTWVNRLPTRAGGTIAGWVFRTGGADYWMAKRAAYDMPGIFTHYQVNGAWGWHVVHNNLHNRLPFTIDEPWWPGYAPVQTPEKVGRLTFRNSGSVFMLGDAASDFGLLRPVFRHGKDRQPTAHFAFMDSHVEALRPGDILHDYLPGSFPDTKVADPRLWKSPPGIP